MLAKQTTQPQKSICKDTCNLTYAQRAALSQNQAARSLLALMEAKKTNLCVAADVTTKQKLLELANQVGPEICLLKTHIDIITDFDWDLIEQLQALAQKHNFMIFEDRKFADIGNTVQMQYRDGIYKISSWAHIINAHSVPGPGIILGLQEVAEAAASENLSSIALATEDGLYPGKGLTSGLILLAQMSSKGTLANGEYTKQTVAMAEQFADFVIGFISREKLTDDPRMIHFTPGIQMAEFGDPLGQQYLTPEHCITNLGTDVIIVGRGIYAAGDPSRAAQDYRKAGWEVYTNFFQK